MPPRKLYFESLRVGDELPALAKAPIERVLLCRYAGASGDYNPMHIDEIYARSMGMPSVYVPGMLVMGFLGQLVTDWARGTQLRHYSVRFIKMVWPGDTVVCKGRVTDRHGEGGRYFAELDLWAENQKGELLMKGRSQIQLFYSLEDENRQRAGQGPIVLNVARESILTPPPPAPEGTKELDAKNGSKLPAKKPPPKASEPEPEPKRVAAKGAKK